MIYSLVKHFEMALRYGVYTIWQENIVLCDMKFEVTICQPGKIVESSYSALIDALLFTVVFALPVFISTKKEFK